MIAAYEERYVKELKAALEAIEGVDDVTVVVNLDSTELKLYEKKRSTQQQTTEESDKEGGKRTIENESTNEEVIIIHNGEEETPLVVATKKPDIRGVLVVAKGADNLQIKKWIVEAVTRVLNVPSYRVAVLPKNDRVRGGDRHVEKQTVWLLTMLSLVVVLSVYYVTAPKNMNDSPAFTANKKRKNNRSAERRC